jgi:hypothetical protein
MENEQIKQIVETFVEEYGEFVEDVEEIVKNMLSEGKTIKEINKHVNEVASVNILTNGVKIEHKGAELNVKFKELLKYERDHILKMAGISKVRIRNGKEDIEVNPFRMQDALVEKSIADIIPAGHLKPVMDDLAMLKAKEYDKLYKAAKIINPINF